MKLQFEGEKIMANKENKVVYGLKNAHYAKLSFDETGAPVYATPVAMKGAVELSLEPESNDIQFSADDDASFFAESENQGYSGTLTLANLSYAFRADILGELDDDTDGTITELADAKMSPFALLFQFDGDVNKTRHLVYYCIPSRAKLGSKTGKDIEGVEMTFKAKQLDLGESKLVKTQTTTEQSAKYLDWFTQVYVKGQTPAEG